MPGDLFHLPDSADYQQWFENDGGWQTWLKPTGIRMVFMQAWQPGAGGGGGFSAGGATQAGGGGGGGSGSIGNLLIPALLLPDILYIFPGTGGAAGAPSGAGGTPAAPTYVSSWASNTPVNSLYLAPGSTAGAGGAGTAIAGGAAGAGSTASSASSGTFAYQGLSSFIGGTTGVAGSAAGAAGNNGVNAQPGIGPGGGGAGTTGAANFTGSNLSVTTGTPWFITNIAGGSVASGQVNGSPGYRSRAPLFFMPGTGGGSNFSGTAGAGGIGDIACGGSGGGGGVTGGPGGRGGDGLVIITCW